MVGFLRSLLNSIDITASPYANDREHRLAFVHANVPSGIGLEQLHIRPESITAAEPPRRGSRFIFRMSQIIRANNRMA